MTVVMALGARFFVMMPLLLRVGQSLTTLSRAVAGIGDGLFPPTLLSATLPITIERVTAIFIAQAYGIELSFATQFLIVMVALLTSTGVAGISSASLVAISIILIAIGLILVVDRLLDMCRTTVNVLSDSCGAVVQWCSGDCTQAVVQW